jgi:LmbE family N-acetylglucosaminyl deacetylase
MAVTAGELLAAAYSFPFRPLGEMLEDRPFIVIAPHPDDESLACGGLIADACEQGLRTKVVMVSDGVGSHPNSKAYPPERLRFLREEEAKQAGAELGLKPEDMLFLYSKGARTGEGAGRADVSDGDPLVGAAVALSLLSWIGPQFVQIEPNLSRAVADFHPAFNIVLGLAFLPLLGPFTRLLERMLPDRIESRRPCSASLSRCRSR